MNEPIQSPVDTPTEPVVTPEPKLENQTVSYESHRKLLSEKKRRDTELAEARARIEEFERQKNEDEEKRLKENEQWKEYAAKKEQEALAATERLKTYEAEMMDAKKLDAFLSTIDGKIDRKYWGFIDTDSIITNPETGEIDATSVSEAVNTFKTTYSEIVQYPNSKTPLPTRSPIPSNSTLTYEEWKKLPAKEMRERYDEMLANDRA